MLLESFDEYCDSYLYTLKLHLPDHMVERIQKSEMFSVLDRVLHAHFNVYIKHPYRATLQRRRTRVIETVNKIDKNLERRQPYKKGEIDGEFGWK